MPLTQLWPANITIKAVTLTCVTIITVMLCCVMTNKKLARVTMATMAINAKQYC